jgi:hypothetical protein
MIFTCYLRVADEFSRCAQYAPVSGVIKAVNEQLGDQPSLLNKSAEDKGASKDYSVTLKGHQANCISI